MRNQQSANFGPSKENEGSVIEEMRKEEGRYRFEFKRFMIMKGFDDDITNSYHLTFGLWGTIFRQSDIPMLKID